MSTDLRNDLERARQRAPRRDAHADFDALWRRRDRRARVRKAGTLTLALLLGAAIIGGAFAVQHGSGRIGAANGGSDLPVPAGLAMPAGDSLYRRVTSYGPSGGVESTVLTWWASDGSGQLRLRAGDHKTFGPGQPLSDTGPIDYLSTDAAVLREQIIQRMAPDGASPEPADQFTPGPGQSDHVTAGVIRSIDSLLSYENALPDLRAALFRVAAGLDGVQVNQDAVDPVGRPAIELTVTTEEALHTWWFDPQTQQLLARRWTPEGSFEVVESEGFTTSSTSVHTVTDLVPAPEHAP